MQNIISPKILAIATNLSLRAEPLRCHNQTPMITENSRLIIELNVSNTIFVDPLSSNKALKDHIICIKLVFLAARVYRQKAFEFKHFQVIDRYKSTLP